MSRATCVRALLALGSISASASASAQAIALTHETSIYADPKEVALSAPEGVACTDAYVVVADTGNGRLLTFGFKDGRVSGGTEVKLPELPRPQRVQIDSKGNVLALDGKTHRIIRVAADGKSGAVLAVKGLTPPDAPVVAGSFKLDALDNVFVLDIVARKVLVLDPGGTVTRQIELPRDGAVFTDVAVDAGGTIFAVDAVGASVWSADKAATTFRQIAKGMKDRMNFPVYLTVSKGKLFLVDQYGSGVVLLGVDGSYQGRQLSIGWSDGLVNYPSQLCLNDAGYAFVADRFNNRVQAFTTGK